MVGDQQFLRPEPPLYIITLFFGGVVHALHELNLLEYFGVCPLVTPCAEPQLSSLVMRKTSLKKATAKPPRPLSTSSWTG